MKCQKNADFYHRNLWGEDIEVETVLAGPVQLQGGDGGGRGLRTGGRSHHSVSHCLPAGSSHRGLEPGPIAILKICCECGTHYHCLSLIPSAVRCLWSQTFNFLLVKFSANWYLFSAMYRLSEFRSCCGRRYMYCIGKPFFLRRPKPRGTDGAKGTDISSAIP